MLNNNWSTPEELPSDLLSVKTFDRDWLPPSLAPWAADIADRMQCPIDYIAITVIVQLGSLIGRKVGIRPQQNTDWTEVPNIWGCIVGRPGALKSPAMKQALVPLERLEAQANEENKQAMEKYERELAAQKLRQSAGHSAARRKLLQDMNADIDDLFESGEPAKPPRHRYIVYDCTYEALGEICANNPNGLLVYRDELLSLLKTLDFEENASARGFYLSAWNGTGGFTFDRIIRGHIRLGAVCLSLLGSTQPGRLIDYMRSAIKGGSRDDGFIQRFGLLIWPDQIGDWKNVDRWPDSKARHTANETFDRLAALAGEQVGAQLDQYDNIPYLRFTDSSRITFEDWRTKLEALLRSETLHPALESHLAKYRSLVPSVALILHVANGGIGPVSDAATFRAIAVADYAESHARRAYGAAISVEARAAKAILSRIRRGNIQDGFRARDIYRAGWSGLTDRAEVEAGLEMLVDYRWLAAATSPEAHQGGRPTTIYWINPKCLT